MEIINELVNLVIVFVCAGVGYLWKNYTEKDNKLIPIVVTILGVILAIVQCLLDGSTLSFTIIVSGFVSGLIATGGYEYIKQFIELFFKEQV